VLALIVVVPGFVVAGTRAGAVALYSGGGGGLVAVAEFTLVFESATLFIELLLIVL
jgi:hypothetical protein